ncbi:MAG TPA: heavy metal translocating P-type ATPase, partial [Patescibacteria group bacterium]
TGLGALGLTEFALRPYLQFAIASVIFYFSQVFFQHARHEIAAKQYGMMTLVSVAVGAGYLFSAASTFLSALNVEFYLEISTLIWVLLFGHYLEARSSSAAGDALGEIAKLLPKQAHLLAEGKERNVAIEELKKGDVVVVKPGEKVPADGVIVEGEANFNEALISGESKPLAKQAKDQVVAGSICLDGSVQVKLDQVGENSTIGQIQQLVAKAKQTKPSAQALADRAAKVLTFTAIVVALATILVWLLVIGQSLVFALTLAITVLVIACPHALGLAIPTVSTIATTLAVKNGLFVKDLQKLEVVKSVDYVVLDKTGTLTSGQFTVRHFEFMENLTVAKKSLNWKPAGKVSFEAYLQSLFYSLEKQSTHPLAQQIVTFFKKRKIKELPVKKFKNHGGKGVSGVVDGHQLLMGTGAFLAENGVMFCADLQPKTQTWSKAGDSVVYIAVDEKHVASMALGDDLRPESKSAIDRLHQLGVKTAMLTGDNEQVAQAVAAELNIDNFFANVLPENKYEHIKELQDQGNSVMMVGDGVNDAPALTQANVGVAIGAGTEVAVEAGDVVLTRNNPQDIVGLVVLARKVYRKMIENLVWALGYNVVAIPAAAGLFIPWGFRLRPEIGALLMSLSSVIVVINALALKKIKLTT